MINRNTFIIFFLIMAAGNVAGFWYFWLGLATGLILMVLLDKKVDKEDGTR